MQPYQCLSLSLVLLIWHLQYDELHTTLIRPEGGRTRYQKPRQQRYCTLHGRYFVLNGTPFPKDRSWHLASSQLARALGKP